MQVSSVLAASALAAALSFTSVDAAKADVAGLTPCSQSKAFAKRQKNEVKTLTKRLKQVSALCSPADKLDGRLGKGGHGVGNTS